jgi:transketolase
LKAEKYLDLKGGNKLNEVELKEFALQIRKKCLDMAVASGAATHLGGGLSTVEIFAALFGEALNFDASNPRWEDRDRFILSKGHGVLSYFATLNLTKFIDDNSLASFMKDGSSLIAHPIMNLAHGVESSNGSLGQGLSLGSGIATAAKLKGASYRTFVLLGDGECDEGLVWESAMYAFHKKLENLIAIIDVNGFQSDGKTADVLETSDLRSKWESFGWKAVKINGHSITSIIEALNVEHSGRPLAIIAETTKGKGISFMENNNTWHHNRLTQQQYEAAIAELI